MLMVLPPYPLIWEDMIAGRLIPFLGAGASLVGDAPWDPGDPHRLPRGSELSRYLARASMFPHEDERDCDDLAKVSSYFVEQTDRDRLRSHLRKALNHPYECGQIHTFLASIVNEQTPLLIVVTNYDNLVEQAFDAAGKPYDLVVHPSDQLDLREAVLWLEHGQSEHKEVPSRKLQINLKKTTVIYKMHGTIDPKFPKGDNFVITEDDYVEFLHRMTAGAAVPKQFIEHFRGRSFLFLGYSLNDWNLRVILKNVRGVDDVKRERRLGEGSPKSYAIQRKPSELEISLWEHRGVKIFDMTIDDFVQGMREHT
jgi:SIR2-like domain